MMLLPQSLYICEVGLFVVGPTPRCCSNAKSRHWTKRHCSPWCKEQGGAFIGKSLSILIFMPLVFYYLDCNVVIFFSVLKSQMKATYIIYQRRTTSQQGSLVSSFLNLCHPLGRKDLVLILSESVGCSSYWFMVEKFIYIHELPWRTMSRWISTWEDVTWASPACKCRCFKISRSILTLAHVNFRICTPLLGGANPHISFLSPMQASFSDSRVISGNSTLVGFRFFITLT